jgi:hypothetical protein
MTKKYGLWLFCFINISTEISQLIQMLQFMHQTLYFATFLPSAVALKASKIICAKAVVLYHQKCW